MSLHSDLNDDLALRIYRILDFDSEFEDLTDDLEVIYSLLPPATVWNSRNLFEIRVEIIHTLLTHKSLDSDIGRVELSRHFQAECNLEDTISKRLSNRVFSLLKRLNSKRLPGFATPKMLQLSNAQGGKCAHCHHTLIDDANDDPALDIRDTFRPHHWLKFRHFLLPEVDHITPISGFGKDELKNLELLCYACNQGKKAGLIEEYIGRLKKYARDFRSPVTEPERHSAKLVLPLVYYRILIDGRACTECKDSNKPLTIRTMKIGTLPTITNTRTYCYDCKPN